MLANLLVKINDIKSLTSNLDNKIVKLEKKKFITITSMYFKICGQNIIKKSL